MGVWGKSLMVAALGMWMPLAVTAALKDSDCLECHSDKTLTKTNASGKEFSLFVDPAKLAASAHKTNTCSSCHSDLAAEHPDDNLAAKPVDCRQCHERQTDSYGASVHGLAMKAGKLESATCRDCHDSHEVVLSISPLSPLHVIRVNASTLGARQRTGGLL